MEGNRGRVYENFLFLGLILIVDGVTLIHFLLGGLCAFAREYLLVAAFPHRRTSV